MCCGSNKGSGTVVWTAHLSLLLHITCLTPPSPPNTLYLLLLMFLWNLSSGFLLISRAMWVLHIHYQHRHYLAHSLRFTHTNYLPHIAHESTPFYTQNHTSHVAQAWHWRGDTAASVWSQMLPPMAALILLLPCHRGSPPEKRRAAKYRDNRESENRETDSRTDVLHR